MSPTEAENLIRMLCPKGGVIPPEPEAEARVRLCRELYDHLRHDQGYIPKWLAMEIEAT
jgi:hypothetical protein